MLEPKTNTEEEVEERM